MDLQTPLSLPPTSMNVTHYPPPAFSPASGLSFNATGGFLYSYCNMPHVGSDAYSVPPSNLELVYVEVVQRHHKRTPYAHNTFPKEGIPWECDDVELVSYGKPQGTSVASIGWKNYQDPLNPFSNVGFSGSCQLPQISRQGLEDSHKHGADLRSIYVDRLKFLPASIPEENSPIQFRVTSNTITSQVAGALIKGMFPSSSHVTVLQHIDSSDALRPGYSCPAADSLRSAYQRDPEWTAHLTDPKSVDLFKRLDAISGVDPNDSGWHSSFDHYYDNLSSKRCHDKPLPCSLTDSSRCVTPEDADRVYSMGQLEYDLLYRRGTHSTQYSALRYGGFLWELLSHLRATGDGIKYRHGFAHDGSIAPLLGALQVEQMVWPGMGSEVTFELWRDKKGGNRFVRVLWSGKPMHTSTPMGVLDMVPFSDFEQYILNMVGEGAQALFQACTS